MRTGKNSKERVEILIQKGENYYEAVINPDKDYGFSFGLYGEGKTVQETIEDLKTSFNEMKDLYAEEGKEFPAELDFSYKYDVASFLAYYSKILTLAGLERLTGVSQGQLSHYLNGHRNPSQRTVEKIEKNLHSFGSELSQLAFI